MTSTPLDSWYLEHLVCPRDHGRLQGAAGTLRCAHGHEYPVVDGVPVMLLSESPATIDIVPNSLSAHRTSDDPLHLDTLSLSADEKAGISQLADKGSAIDAVVAYLIAATNGLMYKHLIGALDRYPIPVLPLPAGGGRALLDVGCSWGRWTLAASDGGYVPVGIDPSLGAVLAARRVAAATRRTAFFVVGDARHLPFKANAFDTVFSYSVIQHFSYEDAERAIAEMGRVVKPGGTLKVQMPAKFGARCLFHQVRRGFRPARAFEVRYWSLPALRRAFNRVGRSAIDADCYFAIGLQASDAPLMTPALRAVTRASEALKAASRVFRPLVWVADSVFVQTQRAGGRR